MTLLDDFQRLIASFFTLPRPIGSQKHGANPLVSQVVNRPASPTPLRMSPRARLMTQYLNYRAHTQLIEHPINLARADGHARIAFRDGEQPGVLEIISVDAEGKCVVHRVAGLALINLAFKAVDQIKRGAK